MEATERVAAEEQNLPDIVIAEMSGLSLKLDDVDQPANTWQVLQNLDLYIQGSIRKVLPPSLYGVPNVGNAAILDFVNYWAEPNSSTGPVNRVLGLAANGRIYDITTGALWADISSFVGSSITQIPYIEVFPIYFVPFNVRAWRASTAYALNDSVLKYSPSDGKLYVFAATVAGTSGANEPLWTTGNVTDGGVTWKSVGQPNSERFQENALVVQVPNKQQVLAIQYRYDPTNAGEPSKVFFQQSGIDGPSWPPTVQKTQIIPTTNGLALSAGRGCVYTWYDPHTLHESSPSPFAGPTKITEVDNSNMVVTVPGSLLPPLPVDINLKQYQSYQIYYIAVPMATAQAALAQGFESIYFYATKDGGATFYRLTALFDNNGKPVSSSDGACSITDLITLQATNNWKDYFPEPTPQILQNSLRVYDGSGPINLVPDPVNFGAANWSSGNAGQLVIVPGDAPDGQAAVELPGTGLAQPLSTLRSNTIPVSTGVQYYFQAYLDPSGASAGTMRWDIISPDHLVTYLSLTAAAGAAGSVLSGTFTKPADAYTSVRIRVFANNVNSIVGNFPLWADPLMVVGSAVPTVVTNYPTPDSNLIVPAPAALSQDMPPLGIAMALYAGCVFLIEAGTFRVYYSNPGDVQSYGANNFLPLDAAAGVPALELKTVWKQLLIGKQQSISQVDGTFPNFGPATVDPERGVQSIRSTISFGSDFVSLLNTGLTLVGLGATIGLSSRLTTGPTDNVSTSFKAESIIGDPVKPITDLIDPATLHTNVLLSPSSVVDTTQNFYMLAAKSLTTPLLLLASMGHKGPSPWSTMSPPIPPGPIVTFKEVLLPTTGDVGILAFNGKQAYLMFGGTQDGTLTAVAQTQALPDLQGSPISERDFVRIFDELWVEGQDINNWQFQWSVDGGKTFSPIRPLQSRNKLGTNGRQIILQFIHSSAAAADVTPLISLVKITNRLRRKASGVNGV